MRSILTLGTVAALGASGAFDDMRRRGKGFHVVNKCRLLQIPFFYREKPFGARLAAFAFQRFQQGGFFAAYVCTGAQLNPYIEIKTCQAARIMPQ